MINIFKIVNRKALFILLFIIFYRNTEYILSKTILSR